MRRQVLPHDLIETPAVGKVLLDFTGGGGEEVEVGVGVGVGVQICLTVPKMMSCTTQSSLAVSQGASQNSEPWGGSNPLKGSQGWQRTIPISRLTDENKSCGLL